MAAPKKPSGGLSLYADLLEPDKSKQLSATISSAPVKYDVKSGAAVGNENGEAKKKDASLKFQPIKRPQVPAKNKPKTSSTAGGSSSHKFSSSTVTASVSASSPEKQQQQQTSTQQPNVQQSNIEDWIGDDDEYYYQDNKPKHERGGKRKKKKNKPQERAWDWDDIYDPTLPNNYADYKGSEEQAREIRDWKARLYYRQLKEARKARKDGGMGSDEEDDAGPRMMNSMFAPPSTLNFAPPSFDQDAGPSRMEEDDDGDDYYPTDNLSTNDRKHESYDTPPSFARASVPDDASGEDAYMRRMRLSGMAASESPAPQPQAPPMPEVEEDMPTPPPVVKAPDVDMDAKRAEAAAKIAAFKAKFAKPAAPATTHPASESQQIPPPPPPPPPQEEEQQPSGTISRAPVRYNVPPPQATEDTSADSNGRDTSTPPTETTRSSRPGQKGFAERLLKRYGWEKGQGLGASGEGITTAIVAKAEKRKKRSDAEGGGWAAPANMGKIVGGHKKRKVEADGDGEVDGGEGEVSEVVKFTNMLTGLDVRKEIEEGGLMQEIGEEMAREYGNVERVFIWREEMGGGDEVFVLFTNAASAVRAVQGMQGAEFAGNVVEARFWERVKFEEGVYA